MGKILTVQTIEGILYLVEVNYGMLRQQSSPDRLIEFGQLEEGGTHCRLARGGSKLTHFK